MAKPDLNPILACLQAQIGPEQPLYTIVDAAQDSAKIMQLLKYPPRQTAMASLFEGERVEELANVAPYLIEFTQRDNPLLIQLVQQGWQHHWAIYFSYPNGFEAAGDKLRRNLPIKAKDEIGLFRFYDPRVFNLFIPSFDAKQCREFFGAVSHYWVADVKPRPQAITTVPAMLDYQFDGQQLAVHPVQTAISLNHTHGNT